MDLLIKNFPPDLNHKLRLKALNLKTTLKQLVINVLTKEAEKK